MNNNLDRTNDAGFYHDGSRRLQDQFDTRRVADRLNEVQVHSVFSPEDRASIESARMFFLATADALGKPDCSYKGGLPGFVRIVDERTLAFPDYNGNGMYRSLGNVLLNRSVALLFIDFERPQRLRILGEATFHDTDPLLTEFAGAQLIRVRATRIFPNCPPVYSRDAAGQTFRLCSDPASHTACAGLEAVGGISRSAAAIRANTASQPENVCADPGTAKPSVPHFPRCCATSKGVAGSKAAFPDYNGNGFTGVLPMFS